MTFTTDKSILNKSRQEKWHLIYPESDGQPMAENTLQFEWIVLIKLGLEACFAYRNDVFIAGDLFWYPVEGKPGVRLAPDVLVVLGRPKGHRGSYMQWVEEGIAPQVVFEILSPGNRTREMHNKWEFYQQHGVQEYYVYDPDRNNFVVYFRQNDDLVALSPEQTRDFISPLLGVRMLWGEKKLELYHPDGKKFLSYMELLEQGKVVQQFADEQAQIAREQAKRAELESKRAELESKRAELESKRAELESKRAEDAEQRAEKLAEMLKKLGIDPGNL